jgi:hypothetical protein
MVARLSIALAFAALPLLAAAEEASPMKSLQLKPKAAMVETPPALQRAPFLLQPGEPNLDLSYRPEDERLHASRSSCDNAGQSLCYDTASGKIVYKKTRDYMPSLPGMQAEHIALRRDRINFKYTFR